jgi:uncharacterized protein YqhQ
VSWLFAPNLWLQRLTTREPDDAMLEVALAALEAARALESSTEVAAGDEASGP